MASREALNTSMLPKALEKAFFPNTNPNIFLMNEIIRRAGKENLVYALQYGSHVTGDASPTSIHDVMIIVENTKQFHRDNIQLQSGDYGSPKNAQWHAFLNKFGFNFYQTQYRGKDDKIIPAKFAVISKDDFIKGCNGTFPHTKDDERQGAFGLYVAGRIQKSALAPLHKRDDASTAEIESAINMARIDGVWLAMGLLENKFSYDDLLRTYVSLSYKADVRIEKKGKADALIQNGGNNYEDMLRPIIDDFINSQLLKGDRENGYEKIESLSRDEVLKRLKELKLINFLTNYFKNPLTSSVAASIVYAREKVLRVISSNKKD